MFMCVRASYENEPPNISEIERKTLAYIKGWGISGKVTVLHIRGSFELVIVVGGIVAAGFFTRFGHILAEKSFDLIGSDKKKVPTNTATQEMVACGATNSSSTIYSEQGDSRIAELTKKLEPMVQDYRVSGASTVRVTIARDVGGECEVFHSKHEKNEVDVKLLKINSPLLDLLDSGKIDI